MDFLTNLDFLLKSHNMKRADLAQAIRHGYTSGYIVLVFTLGLYSHFFKGKLCLTRAWRLPRAI